MSTYLQHRDPHIIWAICAPEAGIDTQVTLKVNTMDPARALQQNPGHFLDIVPTLRRHTRAGTLSLGQAPLLLGRWWRVS